MWEEGGKREERWERWWGIRVGWEHRVEVCALSHLSHLKTLGFMDNLLTWTFEERAEVSRAKSERGKGRGPKATSEKRSLVLALESPPSSLLFLFSRPHLPPLNLWFPDSLTLFPPPLPQGHVNVGQCEVEEGAWRHVEVRGGRKDQG